MGTFHHGKGDLHGITVVVDTAGSRLFVGRCDTVSPEGVILLDADEHDAEAPGKDGAPVSKVDYLAKAVRLGIWKKHDRLVVPHSEVASVKPLGEYA